MTIPSLTPILDAVRDVRAKYAPDAAELTADILAGGARALAVGQETMAATEQLRTDLSALTGGEVELFDIEGLIGLQDVVDAVLVATGECRSDDTTDNVHDLAATRRRHRTTEQAHRVAIDYWDEATRRMGHAPTDVSFRRVAMIASRALDAGITYAAVLLGMLELHGHGRPLTERAVNDYLVGT